MASQRKAKSWAALRSAGRAGLCFCAVSVYAPMFAFGQTPAVPEHAPAPIELWRGVRHVDTFPKMLPVHTESYLDPARFAEVAAPIPAVAPSVRIEAVPVGLPIPSLPTPSAAPQDLDPIPATMTLPVVSDENGPLGTAGSDRCLPTPASAGSTEIITNLRSTETTAQVASHGPSWLPSATNVATALLTPLFLVAGFWLVLRRFKNGAAPVVRVEYVGGQQTIPVAQIAELLQSASQPMAPAPLLPPVAPPAIEPQVTAERIEIAKPPEQERVVSEQPVHQQEAGVLQQLFEENLKLQEQLREPIVVTM